MNYLFIHNNWPGQYHLLMVDLVSDPGNKVVAISQNNQNFIPGIEVRYYTPFRGITPGIHHYLTDLEQAVIWGQSVFDACRSLQAEGFSPDIVIGHTGWGELLFVKDVWPTVPVLGNFEFFYHSTGADVGFDKSQPVTLDDPLRLKAKNATNLLSFESVDWGHVATKWQESLYPPHIREKLSIVHEGIDTSRALPGSPIFHIPHSDLILTQQDEVVTYVARNLEPYRGFHILMLSLPELLARRPNTHVIIIGADGVSYGPPLANGLTFKQHLLQSVGSKIDLSRVHFLGVVPYETMIAAFQISSAHIYLTFPFVLSWSVMEAMAAGCVVIGSATPPVKEIIEDDYNGILIDFFDSAGLCHQIERVLNSPDRMAGIRRNARQSIVEKYDFRNKALPRFRAIINSLVRSEDPKSALIKLDEVKLDTEETYTKSL